MSSDSPISCFHLPSPLDSWVDTVRESEKPFAAAVASSATFSDCEAPVDEPPTTREMTPQIKDENPRVKLPVTTPSNQTKPREILAPAPIQVPQQQSPDFLLEMNNKFYPKIDSTPGRMASHIPLPHNNSNTGIGAGFGLLGASIGLGMGIGAPGTGLGMAPSSYQASLRHPQHHQTMPPVMPRPNPPIFWNSRIPNSNLPPQQQNLHGNPWHFPTHNPRFPNSSNAPEDLALTPKEVEPLEHRFLPSPNVFFIQPATTVDLNMTYQIKQMARDIEMIKAQVMQNYNNSSSVRPSSYPIGFK